MSLNLYGLIIKVASENNMDVNLETIGRINDLIARGISKVWIENNLDILIK